jgi:uncharacterized protein (TIGR03067 family)
MRLKNIPLLLLLFTCVGCAKPPPPEDGTEQFQGSWHASGNDGKSLTIEAIFAKDSFLLIETKKVGNTTQITSEKAIFQVNLAPTPNQVDLVYLAGENAGKTKFGIFVFENDKLKMCVADFDAPRPTAFVANKNSTLMVWERKNE